MLCTFAYIKGRTKKLRGLADFTYTKLHIYEGFRSTHDSEGSSLLEDGTEKMVEGEPNSPTWKFTQSVPATVILDLSADTSTEKFILLLSILSTVYGILDGKC